MQIATIVFADLDSRDEAVAVVRVIGQITGLALSLKRNGDIEVFFGINELDKLIDALQRARAILGKS